MAQAEPIDNGREFGAKNTRKDDMQEATEEFIEDLLGETESTGESERFKRFLDAQSVFHDYSYRNTLLIHLQCPHATRVAGYRTWQNEFDRQVQEGESAIWIWRPIIASKCPECGNSPSYHESIGCEFDESEPAEWPEGVVAFSPCTVFDISQTEGEPLPTLPTDAEGEGDALLADMLEAADTLSVSVETVASTEWTYGATEGVCDPTTGEIEVEDRANAAVAGTLVHEFAHALLHDGDDENERREREFEAEAVAYVVGRHFGLDMSGSSFYLAAWSEDDTETIRSRLTRINETVREIIDAVS